MRRINTRSFHRATRSTSREINRQIVLNLVREHQPISRADLARRMSVARGIAGSLVSELLAEGSLVEGQVSDAPRGRKPVMLYIRTQDRLVIAVDVRFSRTYVMLTDFAGTQLALDTFETLFRPEDLVRELTCRVRRLAESHAALGQVEGIGVVVPGMVDSEGKVLYAPQLGWRQVSIRQALEERTGLPVQIENASTACALAHMWLVRRAGDSAADFVYVNVSDGVGVGIVMNGQLVRGHGQTAGEFGHIPIDPRGPACVCGSAGCWEAFTSNIATLARYHGREPSARESRDLLHQQELTMTDLIARAHKGDARARATLIDTGRYMGVGLAMIVNALNPSRIIVGGEITAAWDLIQGELTTLVAARALTPAAARTPIIPELTSEHPRLRGATALIAAPLFAAPQVA